MYIDNIQLKTKNFFVRFIFIGILLPAGVTAIFTLLTLGWALLAFAPVVFWIIFATISLPFSWTISFLVANKLALYELQIPKSEIINQNIVSYSVNNSNPKNELNKIFITLISIASTCIFLIILGILLYSKYIVSLLRSLIDPLGIVLLCILFGIFVTSVIWAIIIKKKYPH